MSKVVLAALKSGSLGATAGIARSVDQGNTWAQVYTASSNVLALCYTPSSVFGITYNGHLLKSTDIGLTWSDTGLISATALTCNFIEYIGNDTLVVANLNGVDSAFISYDLGVNWVVLLSSPYRMNHVLNVGGGTALILGSNGGVSGYEYKTTDYGVSWDPVPGIGSFVASDAVYVGGGVVVATGTASGIGSEQIYRSTDYGDTWATVADLGSFFYGISVGWIPDTSYIFVTVREASYTDSNVPLYQSDDLGLTWTDMGNQGAVSLYGGSDFLLYSGRTSGFCPYNPNASIRVSADYAVTWPLVAAPYDPTLFLEMPSATPPVADFSAVPLTGLHTLEVSFMDLTANSPTSWLWSYGDGATGALQNPIHGYTGIGSYTVSLTATNTVGSGTETKLDYITVYGIDFVGTPTTGDASLSVAFKDTTPGTVSSWLWDFGDGWFSTLRDPTHVYTAAGVYTVTLSVNGGANTRTVRIILRCIQSRCLVRV